MYPKLQEYGFTGSYSSLLRYINKNREQRAAPVYRIETKPGEYAQVDFGYLGKIYYPESGKEVKAWVFVLVLCYSRHAYYEIVKNQKVETWCACHIHAFEYFSGVPKILIPDNLKSGVLTAIPGHIFFVQGRGKKVNICLVLIVSRIVYAFP